MNPPFDTANPLNPAITEVAGVVLPSFRRTGQANSALERLRPVRAMAHSQSRQRPQKTSGNENLAKKKATIAIEPALADIVPKDQLQERRKQKQWLLQVRRLRLSIRLLFSLALMAALVMALDWLWQPCVGPIRWVSSPRLVNRAQLEKALVAQSVGTSVWLVNPHQLEDALVKQSPLIASAAVRRDGFPPRLMVSVVEHTPWAAWYELSSSSSSVMPSSATPHNAKDTEKTPVKNFKPKGMRPVLKGLVLPSQEWVAVSSSQPSVLRYIQHPSYPLMSVIGTVHQRPTMEQWQALQSLSHTLAALPELHVQALDVREAGNVRVLCQGPDIYLGPLNSTWYQRFQRITGVLPHLAKWSSEIEAVDLRWEQQVTLHKKGKGRLLASQSEKTPSQFQRP